MFTLREVHSFSQQGSVPGVSIVVSYALVFVSVVVLVAYVHHIANALKVDSIILGDVKSGLNAISYPHSMAAQLGLYSLAPAMYDPDKDELVDPPVWHGCVIAHTPIPLPLRRSAAATLVLAQSCPQRPAWWCP